MVHFGKVEKYKIPAFKTSMQQEPGVCFRNNPMCTISITLYVLYQ